MDLKWASATASIADHVATSLALLIGGVWAYFKFIHGRTFAHRASLSVSLNIGAHGSSRFLSATIALHNIGLSRLHLNRKITGIDLLGAKIPTEVNGKKIHWDEISSDEILEDHDTIEPRETVTDTWIYHIRPNWPYVAYKVRVTVGSKRPILRKGVQWTTPAIELTPTKPTWEQILANLLRHRNTRSGLVVDNKMPADPEPTRRTTNFLGLDGDEERQKKTKKKDEDEYQKKKDESKNQENR